MRKLITFTYTSPVSGRITISKTEHFFVNKLEEDSDYIENIFETHIAPLKCLISYTINK